MTVTVRKWGNSAAVRIPTRVLEAAYLQVDDVVEVREEQGRIVIAPVHQRKSKLDDLLEGITPQNLHTAIDFEPPRGNEIW